MVQISCLIVFTLSYAEVDTGTIFFHGPPADLNTKVVHRSIQTKQENEQELINTKEEIRQKHDIFQRSSGSEKIIVGHVIDSPELLEKRLEIITKGNRFKGNVRWADKLGGYGERSWNLAVGNV